MRIGHLYSYFYGRGNSGGGSYSPELQAWVRRLNSAGYTKPSERTLAALDAFLATPLETGTIYSRMLRGHILHAGSKDAAKVNLKNPDAAFDLTEGGTVTFTEGKGCAFTSGGYFEQPFKSDEYEGIESNVTFITYVSQSSTSTIAGQVFGFETGTEQESWLRPRNQSGNVQGIHYSNATFDSPNANHRGLYVLTQDETNCYLYVNGSKITNARTPVAPTVSQNRLIGAKNNHSGSGVTAVNSYPRNIAVDFIFDRFSDTDEESFREAFEAYKIASGLFDLDTEFDVLNLQSNTSGNFSVSGGAISQWNDLSGSDRHATQGTSGNRPTLVGGVPTFDGTNDFLQLASEFTADTYSLYVVVKATTPPMVNRAIIGGQSVDDYISVVESGQRRLVVSNLASGGETKNLRLYGEEWYQVISIRRDGEDVIAKCNGRELYIPDASLTGDQVFGYIGRSSGGNYWDGAIRAVSIHSEYKSDEEDEMIVNALFNRYALPEESNAIVGFGDSITAGSGSSNALTKGWLPVLAAAKGRAFKNMGVSGSKLTGGSTAPGVTRFSTQLIERPYTDTICILYGTNDISGGGLASTYQTSLETVLNGLIDAGYQKSKIIVGTIPYRLGNADESLVLDYNARITSVCASLGLPEPADVYNSMLIGGGDDLLTDEVHPNDAGHAVIAAAFAERIP